MSNADAVPKIKHFIYAADPRVHDGFYGVYTTYFESDALAAVGAVYRFQNSADGLVGYSMSLNTGDDLACVAASPEGNLWVGSSRGNVWTTADVTWSSSLKGIESEQEDPHFSWKVMPAPQPDGRGGYNLSAIWASSDRNVYFGTFQGAIFNWDGGRWSVSHAENKTSIVRMHGTGASDIWAVGRDGLVLHFDGKGWRGVPLPQDDGAGEVLTGVWALSSDEVYICSSSGKIFHGSRHGLELVGAFPHSFFGIVEFEGRLLLAAGDAGVCELVGNRVEVVRGSFAATGVYAAERRVLFVEPAQKKPRVIVHEPSSAKPWLGWG